MWLGSLNYVIKQLQLQWRKEEVNLRLEKFHISKTDNHNKNLNDSNCKKSLSVYGTQVHKGIINFRLIYILALRSLYNIVSWACFVL